MMKSIYEFTDYRKYLRAWYEERKTKDAHFSYRIFNALLGFSSPNYVQQVLDGKRNLTVRHVPSVVEGLGLSCNRARYFELLVKFDRTKRESDKAPLLHEISQMRKHLERGRIESSQYDYYSKWYHTVLRELVKNCKANDVSYKHLSQQVNPPISEREAKQSVKVLRDLGLIVIDENGYYRQSQEFIGTSREARAIGIRQYHNTVIELARTSIERVASRDREISAMTVKISRSGFSTIKKRIREFEDELLEIVAQDSDVDSVYQVNFQLFPVGGYQRGKDEIDA
ncbi:MAG: TIGR02147 family protein [Chitinivibrionales bacterium]|nr:TIGR02147 family protein [Chitinivibrionales bacterium]